MFEEYPKQENLTDGTSIVLRIMTKDDKDKLIDFFTRIPEEDRIFLKENVADEKVIQRWIENLDYNRIIPILAIHNEKIIADATLHLDQYGWQRHVGEIRAVVDRAYQRKGTGTILLKELFHIAIKKGLDKILGEVMVDDVKTIKMMERLGFKQDAVLKDHVMDIKGKKHNLIIMSNYLSELWHSLEDMILDAEFAKDLYH